MSTSGTDDAQQQAARMTVMDAKTIEKGCVCARRSSATFAVLMHATTKPCWHALRCKPDAEVQCHVGTADQRRIIGVQKIADIVFRSSTCFASSCHRIHQLFAKFKGCNIVAITFAVTHVPLGARIHVRGLRSKGELFRMADGWRIYRRFHSPLWQTDAEAVVPKIHVQTTGVTAERGAVALELLHVN